LLSKWVDGAEAGFLTGDPFQALYVWRGASPEVFWDPSVPDSHRRVLGQSYRLPAAIKDFALGWLKRYFSDYHSIEFKPRPAEGFVKQIDSTWQLPEAEVRVAEQHLDDGDSVMFATTCGYQLQPLIQVLRQRAIPYANPWRTKRGDWNPLGYRRGVSMAQRLLAYLAIDPSMPQPQSAWTMRQVQQWIQPLQAKGLLSKGAKQRLLRLVAESADIEVQPSLLLDLFESEPISRWFQLHGGRITGDTELEEILLWWRQYVLKTKASAVKYPIAIVNRHGPVKLLEQPRCYVGTCHSVKGGEADYVFLYPSLSPAGWREWHGTPKQRDNVVRTLYVGMTRARKGLYICGELP